MSIDTLTAHETRISHLEDELRQLKQSLDQMKRKENGAVEPTALPQYDQLRRMTESMFAAEVESELVADPAFPDEQFVVFHVAKAGTADELVAQQREWQREVLRLAPQAPHRFRISISPR